MKNNERRNSCKNNNSNCLNFQHTSQYANNNDSIRYKNLNEDSQKYLNINNHHFRSNSLNSSKRLYQSNEIKIINPSTNEYDYDDSESDVKILPCNVENYYDRKKLIENIKYNNQNSNSIKRNNIINVSESFDKERKFNMNLNFRNNEDNYNKFQNPFLINFYYKINS